MCIAINTDFIFKTAQKIINVSHCRFYFQNSMENYQCVTLPILFSKQCRNQYRFYFQNSIEVYQCVTDSIFVWKITNVSLCCCFFPPEGRRIFLDTLISLYRISRPKGADFFQVKILSIAIIYQGRTYGWYLV